MAVATYNEAMGDDGAHIRLKLDNSAPIALGDFVASFVGLGSQFEKFISRERPDLRADSEIFIQEVRAGCIEADLVWAVVASAGALVPAALWTVDAIDKGQVLAKFIGDLRDKLTPYFRSGGRSADVTRGDLADFLKATAAIANDPEGSAKLEAAVFEDGERKVRAEFHFTSEEARIAERELEDHRVELAATSDVTHERVLLRFVRPSVEASKPGKKGGERGVIDTIARRAMPVLYVSTLAEERMRHEKMQLEGNVFRALFDVSVNIELSPAGRPVAYRVVEVHAVIDDEDPDTLGLD